ncbi:DNA polymerase III subunit gamma/tau [Candidatus Gottesmanbacteria bacterium]|nr:DNA polymerase III subunit gamma/tau [Candidatus Gottesmanbacteria bacterium]
MVVLYRKYRPQKLSDLVGQEHICEMLLNSFKTGKISHAYLFVGPRGTGKTTTARILAKMLNCDMGSEKLDVRDEKSRPTSNLSSPTSFSEPCNKCDACIAITDGSYLDVLEIDAASNRGIDDIRDLREKIKLAPAFGRYKVYIIDEVHMLTGEAFNALLKTLEEPPEHTVFILCTTDPKKVPETISSRCQKFEFKKASREDIVTYLKRIIKEEKIDIDDMALQVIAQRSEGAFRNAASLLDQAASGGGKLTAEQIAKNLSVSDDLFLEKYLTFLYDKNVKEGLLLIKKYVETGLDINAFVRDLLLTIEKYLLIKMEVVKEEKKVEFSLGDLKKLASMLSLAENEMKFSFVPELPLELLTIEWCEVIDKTRESNEPAEPKSEEVAVERASVVEEKIENKTVEPKEQVDIKGKWPDVLKSIKPYNHSLEMLLRKCHVESFDGETLSLIVYYKLHKDLLMHPKNFKVIQECLQTALGNGIKLELKLAERKQIADADESEDLIEAAQEIFK